MPFFRLMKPRTKKVDLSGKSIKKVSQTLKKAGFNASTESLNLSKSNLTKSHLRSLFKFMDSLADERKLSLVFLDVTGNNFPVKDHADIREILQEISTLMAKGRVIEHKQGNNGFKVKYWYNPRGENEEIFLQSDSFITKITPYYDDSAMKKSSKRKSGMFQDLLGCFPFMYSEKSTKYT
mmetsp:Transcript_5240/g.6003  ORF Transcript_5240/g.6003 Transcript_5240/m.6003 type:complete len:180 (+) Transcript_5240:211-750(+)|eukprot:CAMPEP_0184025898 /NCGR_PEP_ID=MMETSP0954-20121128/13142_1 /TAXON_ID=627963 /ORGANISM="Aplanochytrium sp, Strain PBS07" /LENGTH=179 /DNA_ID=CAMNT_0026309885 /DNA_START=151 /DNA_END=690 /DNA_ORIENTATION=+